MQPDIGESNQVKTYSNEWGKLRNIQLWDAHYRGVCKRLLWGSKEVSLGRGEGGYWGSGGWGREKSGKFQGKWLNDILASSGPLTPGPGPGTEWRLRMLVE